MTIRNALVTGATGYIGHRLVRHLAGAGVDVHALIRRTSNTASLPPNLPCHVYDGTDESVGSVIGAHDFDAVFHLAAAQSHIGQEVSGDTVSTNILLPLQILRSMAEVDCWNFVAASTYWEYDGSGNIRPNSIYAASKSAVAAFYDYFAARGGISVTNLVLYDVYGEDDWRNKILSAWAGTGADDPAFPSTPGDQTMSFVHVDDVARGFIQAAKRQQPNEGLRTFALPASTFMTLREAHGVMESVFGRSINIGWGQRDYPPHQIMEPVSNLPTLPGWQQTISLEEGMRRLKSAGDAVEGV